MIDSLAIKYKPIDGHDLRYVIFTTGKIYDTQKGNFVATTMDTTATGYKKINVELKTPEGARRHCLVSRLLAEAFIPKVKGKKLIDHINRDSLDNNLKNLRWVNHSENRANSKVQKNNKLGYKHLTLDDKGYYRVRVVRPNKTFCSSYKNIETAIAVRNAYLDFINEPYDNLD